MRNGIFRLRAFAIPTTLVLLHAGIAHGVPVAAQVPRPGGEELLPPPRLTGPADDQLLPPPRSTNPMPGWNQDPRNGEWIDPLGVRWRFDGLRWKVLWENNEWYPVIPPGPLPFWRSQDFGMGWTGILPPNSSRWHVVPPSVLHMPPPWRYH